MKHCILSALLAAAALASVASTSAAAQSAPRSGNIQHVLLISIDGMHALDVSNYVQNNPGSALAELSSHGITYTDARTPQNSDSFPGLLALITGGSPLSHGLFYDASYDRAVFCSQQRDLLGSGGQLDDL